MNESTAIGMVSESLRNLLTGEMNLSSSVDVTILAPDEEGDTGRRLNLFLYKIQENPLLKNMDWQPVPGTNLLAPPPLSLNLYYIMTPYSNNDPLTGNATSHEILGEGMRIFHENPVIPTAYLHTGLAAGREDVKIILNTLDMEELSKVWATFSKAFRLSVLYEVSVVQIDMLPEKRMEIAPRARAIGVPSVGAAQQPPSLAGLEPVTVTQGGTVTITGANLTDWTAHAQISGRIVADGTTLTGDAFPLTVPADLPVGFHEVRVDVGHLCRKTFLIEVTAA